MFYSLFMSNIWTQPMKRAFTTKYMLNLIPSSVNRSSASSPHSLYIEKPKNADEINAA